MTLPAAACVALWASHFRAGNISADDLIDHCGPLRLETLSAVAKASAVELVVVDAADSSGVSSVALPELTSVGSGIFLRGLDALVLPDDYELTPATRAVPTVARAEAERLLAVAMEEALATFEQTSVFGMDRPSIPEVNFPALHPARMRELFMRSLTIAALASSLRSGWSTGVSEQERKFAAISQLESAARRGFEAAVML